MKPKHQRLVFVSVSVVFLCVGVVLTLDVFRNNLVFFYSPSDLQKQTLHIDNHKIIRIGGLVKDGSIEHADNNFINFIITDGNAEIKVSYNGILPNLFREGQGCVVEGYMISVNEFIAQTVLAKHDEKYMPKEVVDVLKHSGNWHGGENK